MLVISWALYSQGLSLTANGFAVPSACLASTIQVLGRYTLILIHELSAFAQPIATANVRVCRASRKISPQALQSALEKRGRYKNLLNFSATLPYNDTSDGRQFVCTGSPVSSASVLGESMRSAGVLQAPGSLSRPSCSARIPPPPALRSEQLVKQE